MTMFTRPRDAARALLQVAPLKPREGQFCGGLAFSDDPLTPRQRQWIEGLLDRHGLAPLVRPESPE